MFHPIDYEQWDRRPYYEYYTQQVCCSYSITCNLDLTKLLPELKQRGIKLFPTLIYLTARVVNRHPDFRIARDEHERLGFWEELNPSYTVFHPENESFSNIWSAYREDFSAFYQGVLEDMDCYGKRPGIFAKPDCPPNHFPISCEPWVSFTGFNINVFGDSGYLLPMFTFGRYFTQDGKTLIPFSLQIHHAVADGFHSSRLILEIQELADAFEAWIG